MCQSWFWASRQFRKISTLPNVGTPRLREQHPMLLPPCKRKVKVWGEHCGEGIGGTGPWWQRNEAVDTIERCHLSFPAAIPGVPGKGAKRLLGQPCPGPAICLTSDPMSRTAPLASPQPLLPEERSPLHAASCEKSLVPGGFRIYQCLVNTSAS